MTRPDFVLVGVPRSGTTSLYNYLKQHPQVAVSRLKEINFLAYPGAERARRDYPWLSFPVTTLAAYEELFADAGDGVKVDFSASCFRSEVAVARIREFAPRAGLIVVLRDPVTRAYSAYLNQVRKGYESRPPEEALVPGQRAVDNGFYSERLRAFWGAFGRERVRVWLFDDLRDDPHTTVSSVFAHLGVDPSVRIDASEVFNRASLPRSAFVHRLVPSYGVRRRLAGSVPKKLQPFLRSAWDRNQSPAPSLPAEVETRLRHLFETEVRQLEAILERDLGAWLPGTASPAGSGPHDDDDRGHHGGSDADQHQHEQERRA